MRDSAEMLATVGSMPYATASQLIEQAQVQFQLEKSQREKRRAIAERSWMNRAQRRAAARAAREEQA